MKALDRVDALFVPCELVTLHHGEPVSRILRDDGIPVRGVASSGVVFDQTLWDGRPPVNDANISRSDSPG